MVPKAWRGAGVPPRPAHQQRHPGLPSPPLPAPLGNKAQPCLPALQAAFPPSKGAQGVSE